MAVKIDSVIKNSPAYKSGLRSGDLLVSINGFEINDFLDYRFYSASEKLFVKYYDKKEKYIGVNIYVDEFDDLGLVFNDFLMDKEQSCKNKCIFCFIDQMPKGLRGSLYFKDDDHRLGFLFGNYITLTNLSQKDIDRIIAMKISPVNISVHTTNPDLRVRMMKNPHSGNVLKYIYKLADAGIKMNFQLVLCPGINDGEELRKSLEELGKLYPEAESVACVPVGITKYRDGLESLKTYTKEGAEEVLNIIEKFSDIFYVEHKTRFAYPADEFFLKAKRNIPPLDYYGEDLNQLENGIGMSALFRHDFMEALEDTEKKEKYTNETVSIATGYAAFELIRELTGILKKKYSNINCIVFPVRNDFFGNDITVSGLITGRDIINQLKGKISGKLLIPLNMLKSGESIFLDGITVEQVSSELGTRVIPVESNGRKLVEAIL